MARKSILVCDFSGNAIPDEKHAATITVKFGDGRRNILVADAHVDDPIVAQISAVGRQQARRGRRPRTDGA
jgi:hypothetical protein